jgi:hypothetical protein
VSAKQQQLQQLQAEHASLQSKLDMLGNAVGSHEAMVAQLAALNLSVGPVDVPAAAAAANDAESAQAGSSSGSNISTGSATTAVNREQVQQMKQQQMFQIYIQDVPVLYTKYRLYAQQCAARIIQAASAQPAAAAAAVNLDKQQQKQQQRLVAAAIEVLASAGSIPDKHKAAAVPQIIPGIPIAAEDDTGYPPFPLNLLEVIAFSKLSRAVGTDVDEQQQQQQQQQGDASTSSSSSSGSQDPELHMRTINLVTLKHDVVAPELWANIAGYIQLRPHQRQQLEAGWTMYGRAVQKLNDSRQRLRQQLQRAIDSDAAPATAAAACEPQKLQQTAAGGLAQLLQLHSNCSSISSASSSMAAGMSAAVLKCSSGNVAGCFAVQRQCSSAAGVDLQELEALADAVERSLMQGRAVITAFGWSQMMALDNEQMAAMIVLGFPYLPLIRGVVGHLLGKQVMQQ